jgi:transcriptional regulator with XRE-family HTH domain
MNDRANQERFAARVAALRDELGLSLDDVGAAVGVSGETIRNWERCRFVPRKKVTVTKLEQALEARTGELWALLKGYEIPAKRPSKGDDSGHLVEAILRELTELRAAIAEIEAERRPGRNGGPPVSRRGSSRERVPQAS